MQEITTLPQFTSLDINSFPSQLEQRLQSNLDRVKEITSQEFFTWDNLMRSLEDMEDELERFFSPLVHLHSVMDRPALRDCYQACLPKLSAYEAAIGQNSALYEAIKSLDKNLLNSTQLKIIEDTLQGFELTGVALDLEKKARLTLIQTQLSELSSQFENNILDAEQAFSLHITNKERLKGLPEHAINTARELAERNNQEGWIFNLEIPCYLAVATYADDRALREEMYSAYITRASDQGPLALKFDNSALIDKLLALRHEQAQILGFSNYAELSLATKMTTSPQEVLQFLTELSAHSYQQANREFQSLKEFALTDYAINDLAPWDIAYFSEKARQLTFNISQEDLRPYFSLPRVMAGLFELIYQLYGMTLKEIKGMDIWHDDVKCYQVSDEHYQVRGYIYVDLFARPKKRGGAWMDSLQSRRKLSDGTIQLPIATLTCNFAKISSDTVALSHHEVITLFHEFGHCLHHVLTQVDYFSASGIHGVEWDAVELPSQIFENWCWEKEVLVLLTQHIEHGESLSTELITKLRSSKNFQSAMAMVRQLEFSLFDFRIHKEFSSNYPDFVSSILEEVRQTTSVVPVVPYNRFPQSFSHIFSGGYAAGYYSYKWAEVLSSDAFSRFEEEGIFNQTTGRAFLHSILEVGSSKKAAEAYLQFRGRPATIDALLRHNEIK